MGQILMCIANYARSLLIVLCQPLFILAEPAVPVEELIAPLMSLNEQPSPTVSFSNRRQFLSYSSEEKARTVVYLEKHQLPWLSLFAGLLIVLEILLIRFYPPLLAKKQEGTPSPSPEKLRNEINGLIHRAPFSQKNAKDYSLQLDRLFREYVKSRYQISLQSVTPEEFAAYPLSLEREKQVQILLFLKEVEKNKFTDAPIKKEDAERVEKLAQTLIRSDQ